MARKRYTVALRMPKDGPLVMQSTVPNASLKNPFQGYPTNNPYGTNSTGTFAYSGVADRITSSSTAYAGRSETWVEDTMVHWHLYPEGFSWEKYKTDRDTWLKYNASIELRARNYWYTVYTFEEHRYLLTDYWCGTYLEIY